MPKPKPMTPEAFARRWIDGEMRENRYSEIKELEEQITQRDRALLEAAAERAVEWSHEKYPPGTESLSIEEIKAYLDEGLRKAILAPLEKEGS